MFLINDFHIIMHKIELLKHVWYWHIIIDLQLILKQIWIVIGDSNFMLTICLHVKGCKDQGIGMVSTLFEFFIELMTVFKPERLRFIGDRMQILISLEHNYVNIEAGFSRNRNIKVYSNAWCTNHVSLLSVMLKAGIANRGCMIKKVDQVMADKWNIWKGLFIETLSYNPLILKLVSIFICQGPCYIWHRLTPNESFPP